MSADYRARALALLAQLRKERATLNVMAEMEEDAAEVFERLMNKFWGLLYPDTPTSWEYPGQVFNHIRVELERLKAAQNTEQEDPNERQRNQY